MRASANALLVVCFLVCPLLFFTNLTRNPYVTQICLLNVALLASATLLAFAGEAAATAADVPLAGVSAAFVASFLIGYFGHRAFYRPAMGNEGLKAFLFLGANCLAPFWLAATLSARESEADDVPLGHWVGFTLAWGLLWTAYPSLRSASGAPGDVWAQVWDPAGAALWVAGLAGAGWLCRKGRAVDVVHLVLSTGFLAAVYGVLQYFNVELIWPNVLNPYGGRSVSTFGNPNFMSSFDVVLLPAAWALFARERGGRRLVYAAVAVALEAGLLCSLTRSSWLGVVVALGVLAASTEFRRQLVAEPKPVGLLAGVSLALALLWPQSSIVSGYTPSVLGRLSEVKALAAPGDAVYSPWHQRLLIWTCAWQMGAENPLSGKGWGLFELFYPFYQGPLLDALDFYRFLRTHANNCHNELLELWSQAGLLGVGASVWLWTTCAVAARPLFRAPGRRALLAAAFAAGATGMLADNFLNVSVHFAVPALMFWWAAGHALGRAADDGRGGPRRAIPRAAAVVVALAALGGGWYWARVWMRETEYFAGFKLMRQKNLPAAIRHLEASRDWGPPEVNAIYELGNAYAQSQRYPEADAAYRLALGANAGYDEIFYNSGAINATHLGLPDRAIEQMRMAWWINPVSADVYNSLGNLYLQNPQRYRAEAFELLERAVHFFPENPNHWNNLGYLYSLEKRYDDAVRSYARALALDPDLVVARRNLESVARLSGRPRPPEAKGLDALIETEARVARKDYSDATISAARRAVALLPETAKARYLLGSLLLARGRAAEAVEPLSWAAQRQSASPWVHLNLGEAFIALGRYDEAAREYRLALAADPNNAAAKQRLQQLAGRPR